jgi:hypothetical protein
MTKYFTQNLNTWGSIGTPPPPPTDSFKGSVPQTLCSPTFMSALDAIPTKHTYKCIPLFTYIVYVCVCGFTVNTTAVCWKTKRNFAKILKITKGAVSKSMRKIILRIKIKQNGVWNSRSKVECMCGGA